MPAAKPPSRAQAERLRECVSVLIRVFHVNERTAPPAEGRTKYSPYDFQTLGFIARNPDCMATAVAAYLVVSPTTATSIIERLEARGLVVRERPESNRRAIALSLTSEGRTLHAAILRQDLKNTTTMLDPLTPDERDVFLDMMSRIVTRVEQLADDGDDA